MEAATVAILHSLKEIGSQLETLNNEWINDKGNKTSKQSNMITGLHTQITAMGTQLQELVKSLKSAQGVTCSHGGEAKSQSRQNYDYLDDLDQRSLLGKIAINVQDPDMKKRIGILETGDYNSFDFRLLITEVNRRYGIHIDPNEDIKDARRVSRAGTIVLTFFDLKPGSKYFDLVSAIKTKGSNSKGQKLYANFVLTNRRNSLLYEIRKAFKAGKLEKYFSDYDGSLVIVKKGSTNKIRVTSQATKANDYVLTTLNKEELLIHLQ